MENFWVMTNMTVSRPMEIKELNQKMVICFGPVIYVSYIFVTYFLVL
jgi:hypothetical protein